MNRGRVGEERGGKETDGCSLTFDVRSCFNMDSMPALITSSVQDVINLFDGSNSVDLCFDFGDDTPRPCLLHFHCKSLFHISFYTLIIDSLLFHYLSVA
jgi:hypothetical protein